MVNNPLLRLGRKNGTFNTNKFLLFSGFSHPEPVKDDLSPAEYAKLPSAISVIGGIVLCALMLISSCKVAHAAEIPQEKAVKAIIGEAENQGFQGMLAIAHALRNRGTLRGVYGLNSPRVKHHLYSAKTLAMAQKAWEQSAFDFDLTHGSTGWGNSKDGQEFAKAKWWNNCVVVFRYKQHFFYKEIA